MSVTRAELTGQSTSDPCQASLAWHDLGHHDGDPDARRFGPKLKFVPPWQTQIGGRRRRDTAAAFVPLIVMVTDRKL